MASTAQAKTPAASSALQFTVARDDLLKSLAHMQSIVEKRNTIPILLNILIQTAPNGIRLAATDMDMDVVETMAATIKQEGAATVNASTLYEIMRKLPEGADVELSFVADNATMTVKSGRARFVLATLPVDDFPALSQASYSHEFEIAAEDLRALIDKTRFAISNEETRYYLNGIYFHATEHNGVDVLRAVATDGHRLARTEMPMPQGASGMPGIIVPRKTVLELRKLLDAVEDSLKVSVSETRIGFVFDNIALSSKLIDGTFPDYQRVIPSGNDKVMEVDVKSFAAAVDRVATITMDKSRAVKMRLAPGQIELSAQSPEHGSANEEIEVSYKADAMEIGFNARYVNDIVQQIEGDQVQLMLSDMASPVIVQSPIDQSTLYVLMPMRV